MGKCDDNKLLTSSAWGMGGGGWGVDAALSATSLHICVEVCLFLFRNLLMTACAFCRVLHTWPFLARKKPVFFFHESCKRKLNLSMCTPWRRMGEWRYSLTSALDEVEWSGSRSGRFISAGRAPGTHCRGGWVLTFWRGNNLLPVPGVELRLFCRTACCLVALCDYWHSE